MHEESEDLEFGQENVFKCNCDKEKNCETIFKFKILKEKGIIRPIVDPTKKGLNIEINH